MKLKDLRMMIDNLKELDGDVDVVSGFYIEMGRGGSFGLDENFNMVVKDVGEYDLECDENFEGDVDVWDKSENRIKNKNKMIVIDCDSVVISEE